MFGRMAREGIPFFYTPMLIMVVLIVLHERGTFESDWATLGLRVLIPALFALGLFTRHFFRDPPIAPPTDTMAVLSPAEGRVVEIVTVDDPPYLGEPGHRISIFLSIFNVHIQRAPLEGTVELREYNPGLYLAAWEPKASEANEQASLGIRTEHGPILVRQIAGLVARRIVTDPDVGDEVAHGARIGLIRFGSRVDLFLPADWPLEVQVDDKVSVGTTVVARVHPATSPETS